MDSYDVRLQDGIRFAKKKGLKGIDLAIEMYKNGYSLRIIQDITAINKSMLQRYFTQNHITRTNEYNTKKRTTSLHETEKLYKEGYSVDDIAEKLGKNKRTIKAYLRQLGYLEKTNFKWL